MVVNSLYYGGIESRWVGEIFRTRPDRPSDLPSLLRYRVFPGGKAAVRGADHPPPSKCRGHERVELYLYSPSEPSWPVIWRTNQPTQAYVSFLHVFVLKPCIYFAALTFVPHASSIYFISSDQLNIS